MSEDRQERFTAYVEAMVGVVDVIRGSPAPLATPSGRLRLT